MTVRPRARPSALVLLVAALAACAPLPTVDSPPPDAMAAARASASPLAVPSAQAIEEPAVVQDPAPAPAPDAAPAGDPGGELVFPARHLPREAVQVGTVAMGTVGGIELLHPSAVIERIGYHESSHEGAQQQAAYDTAARPLVLPSRGRGTGSMTAADVVADPALPIVAPVTGTVIRASTYTLYCDHTDVYVVIAPDVRPDWEVKLLHMVDLAVATGDRVVAGQTVVAGGPRLLPFDSQVDDFTADPSWPHVHLEVVDPSIPNVPSPGGGC